MTDQPIEPEPGIPEPGEQPEPAFEEPSGAPPEVVHVPERNTEV